MNPDIGTNNNGIIVTILTSIMMAGNGVLKSL